jgi:hypothetical protein
VPRALDRTVPSGQTPNRYAFIAQRDGEVAAAPGPIGTLLGGLQALFQDQPIYTIPVPFKYWVSYEITLAAGDNWIDQSRYLNGRRGWALVNWDPVATNFVWINSHLMSAVSQGGRLAGIGGSFFAPIGHGANQQEVHAWPLVAGTAVSFYQFA